MPLQNRVNPWGEIEVTPERGTMLGNRGGKFHRDDKTLGKRRWASHHWICCELHYKGLHHEPMGEGYTSLFFLDEVTALAAGHRPCFFCRRTEAKRFLGERRVDDFDRELHAERLASFIPLREAGRVDAAGGRVGSGHAEGPHPSRVPRATLPSLRLERDEVANGVMVELEGAAWAIRGPLLLRWSHGGYVEARPRKPAMRGRLLTPPSILRILAAGYEPRWHKSAIIGDWA